MNAFPILYTERLNLIEIKPAHLTDLYLLYGSRKNANYHNLFVIKNTQEAQLLVDFLQKRFEEKAGIRWGITLKSNQHVIGTVGFNSFAKKHRANISYNIHPNYRNCGYMSEALRTVIRFGFEHLEINRIEAEIIKQYSESGRILEKFNFKNEGILRQWLLWNGLYHDVIMYSLLKEEYELPKKR